MVVSAATRGTVATVLQIELVPVLNDNYVYLARDPATGACTAVDPSVAGPVLAALDRLGWRLTQILSTHHHHDHVGGNLDLKRATGCTIVGHGRDAARIPGIDVRVEEGGRVTVGSVEGTVLDVSGHTIGHVAYWFAGANVVFCGDTLFSLGCGRLFEGSAAQMWASLMKLRGLPPETAVCCGHEYTAANAAFALALDPANEALRRRAAEVRTLRERGLPTLPSTIGAERATNPFLRANDPDLRHAVGGDGDPVLVFAEIRRRKDVF
jgi:hydroxyacylglutathione hydrolase